MGRHAGRLGDECGQTFVFVATMLFALFIVASTSMVIGQAINRRVMLQILADTGAFTGATEMARGMNTLAQLNMRIQTAWTRTARATAYFTFPPCPASDLAVTMYGFLRTTLGQTINAVNIGYGARASQQAREVTESNAADLFTGEGLSMGETDSASGLYRQQRPWGPLVTLEQVPSGTVPAGGGYAGYRRRVWECWLPPPIPPQPRTASFSLWYRAEALSMPISFVWVVKAPRTRARAFDSFFGPFALPAMTAVAHAKPVGGEIKDGREYYVAKMIAVSRLVGSVTDPTTLITRRVHH